MEVPSCCPFEDLLKNTVEWRSADLFQLQEMFYSVSNCQHHPPLKDITLKGLRHGQTCMTSPLFIAIEEGELEVVKLIIERWGVDINNAALDIYHLKPLHSENLLTFKQASPLFAAAYFKHYEIVRYLVGQKANISAGASSVAVDEDDQEFDFEVTPLHAALLLEGHNEESVQLQIIQFLVEEGRADPNALSPNEPFLSRMVSLACSYTQLEGRDVQFKNWINPNAIFLLIKLGMSVTQKSPSGRTVLHYLAENFTIDNVGDFVNLLLDNGADLHARDVHGFNPIMIAAAGNGWVPNFTFLRYLLERDDVPNEDKIEALEVAAAVLLSYDTSSILFDIYTFDYLTRARDLRIKEGLFLTPS